MAQLLLELFSEEIPARMQARAADDLRSLVTGALRTAHMTGREARVFATPRRLALVVDGVPEAQPDAVEEKRGPRTSAPDNAVQGFLRANGVTLADCERRTVGKAEFWFAVVRRKGGPAAEVLPAILVDAVRRLAWPKSMRWDSGTLRWVRPLRRILCVLDGDTVALDIGEGIPSGKITSGHRFMAPDPFEVGFVDDYMKKLQLRKVIVDPAVRRAVIEEQAAKLAAGEELTIRRDTALLVEVAGLVEWPVCLIGSIDAAFMTLPPEVLTTSMRTHQRYFSLLDKDGRLAPRFVVVANIEAADGGAAIVAGNERVLRARLSDAKFFWDQDRKETLESRVPALADMVFHEKLGSMADRVARLQRLATKIAPSIPGADPELVYRAAGLAKADLTTGMVGEFPELQGVMGRYYALEEGAPPEVADAIARHYAPQGPGDACPTGPVSIAVALADKLDTLAAFWSIDEKPTGSRDPFALRRAALGVIRIVLENKLRLSLSQISHEALSPYMAYATNPADQHAIAADLMSFFADRLKVHLREKGVRHDVVSAVFAVPRTDGAREDDLVRLVDRAEALRRFLESEDGANLLTAYRRASNIVAIEEKKDRKSYLGEVTRDLLIQDEEGALFAHLGESGSGARAAIAIEDFLSAMEAMARLRPPVDAFFDKVTVNSEDPELRENRLHLLSQFRSTLSAIADFGQIEG